MSNLCFRENQSQFTNFLIVSYLLLLLCLSNPHDMNTTLFSHPNLFTVSVRSYKQCQLKIFQCPPFVSIHQVDSGVGLHDSCSTMSLVSETP
jgi:hypothetical protein